MNIQLTEQQVQEARELAWNRLNATVSTKAEGAKRGTYTDFEIDFIGVLSEMAVCQLYGVEMDKDVYEYRTDAGVDFEYKGYTVQLKSTKYFNKPHLLVKPEDTYHDIYMLACANMETGLVSLRGYITRAMLLKREPTIFKSRTHKVRVFKERELIPMKPVG